MFILRSIFHKCGKHSIHILYSIKAYGVWNRPRMGSYSIHIEYSPANHLIFMTVLKPWGKDCTVSNPAFKHSPHSTVWLPNWHIRHAPDDLGRCAQLGRYGKYRKNTYSHVLIQEYFHTMEYIPFLYGLEWGRYGTFHGLSCSIKLWIEPSKAITVPWNEFIINIINNQQGFIQHLQVNTSMSSIKKLRFEIQSHGLETAKT